MTAAAPSPRLRDLPGGVRWLLAGMFVSALGTFVHPFLARFLVQRGLTLTEAGLLAGLWGVGTVLAGPLGGWSADRLGRRPTMAGALALSALLTALLAVEVPRWLLGPLVFGLGVGMGGYRPAAGALIADLLPPEQQPRGYAAMHWVNNLGIAISLTLAGLLAHHGYGLLFLADAATTAAFAALVLWRIPESRPAAPAPAAVTGPVARARAAEARPRGYGAVLGDRHLLLLLGLQLALLLAFFQFVVALPIAMAAAGLDDAAYGRVVAVNGFIIGLAQPALVRASSRRDPGRVLALAALLIAVGQGAQVLCGPAWTWALAVAAWTVGECLLFPTVNAEIAALSPPDLRGRYQGLLSFAVGAGLAGAPPLGAMIMERLGAGVLWGGCAAVGLLVAAAQLAAGPARRRAVDARRAAA